MALQGPFAVIADNPAPDVVDALRAAGASPVIETNWADAAGSLGAVEPEAIILADTCSDQERVAALSAFLGEQRAKRRRPVHAGHCPHPRRRHALRAGRICHCRSTPRRNGWCGGCPPRIRIRTLHGTVLRRMRTLASRGEQLPELSTADPLEEATVLIAGRGRSYPELSVAFGEQVGVVGAFSVESAARALNARDIDGMVIGDGFGPKIVEALLTVLAEDVRFRDLPVAVLGGHPSVIEPFAIELANLERISEGPQRLMDRFLPYVRAHAFGQRLKRMLKSLDAKGMLDPDTGLLGPRSVLARPQPRRRRRRKARRRFVDRALLFDGGDRRISLDAARLLGRLMRQVDFACREADNSIFAVFTETDLRAAHIVARRIASVLKNTMLAPDTSKKSGIDAAVTLATLKPTDNIESLLARVVGDTAAG